MITGIDHIGIAVKSIDEALPLYTEKLGLKLKDIEVVESQKVRTAIIPVGDTKIELLEATSPESAIAKHIEKRGEGMHHIAMAVPGHRDRLYLRNNKKTLKPKLTQSMKPVLIHSTYYSSSNFLNDSAINS